MERSKVVLGAGSSSQGSVALLYLALEKFLESFYLVNFICGVCKVLQRIRGRPSGVLRKGSMRALDQHEQDRRTERGQEMCRRHS